MSNSPFATASLPDDAIELGRIQEAWGIKGWVRILPHSADTSALFESSEWFLQPPEARFARGFSAFSGHVQVHVAEIKTHSDGIVARLDGVDDRSAAEGLKGVRISVINPGFVATPLTAQNDFEMPFLMQPDEAARRTIAGLVAGRFEIAYPRRFVAILRTLRALPYPLFFRLITRFVLKNK